MAYGTPTDPVAGTVITVAYAVANLLDPIRALRAFTGGADPPGTGYVVTSDSTSATSWKTMLAAIIAAVGGTPAKTSGDTFSGTIVLNNAIQITGKDSGGTQHQIAIIQPTNVLNIGGPAMPLALLGSTATPSYNGSTIWTAGNDGAASGLDADLWQGAAPASKANATHAHTGADITDLTLTDADMAVANKDGAAGTYSMRTLGTGAAQAAAGNHAHTANAQIASGSYTGDGTSGRSITVGFTPKLVLLSWANAPQDIATATLISTTAGTTIVHGVIGGAVNLAGIQDAAVLAANGFTVYGSGGGSFNPYSNMGSITYRWVAFA